MLTKKLVELIYKAPKVKAKSKKKVYVRPPVVGRNLNRVLINLKDAKQAMNRQDLSRITGLSYSCLARACRQLIASDHIELIKVYDGQHYTHTYRLAK